MTNQFKNNFKKLREKTGKTQGQIADDLMINRSTIGAYEEGRSVPKYDRLIIIAGYFKITIDQFLKEKL